MPSHSFLLLGRAAICATMLVAAAAVQPASASIITESFSFSFSNFVAAGDPTVVVPVDPWTGQFTITFDPAASIQKPVDSFSSNLTLGIAGAATWTFQYQSSNQEISVCDTGCTVFGGTAGSAALVFEPGNAIRAIYAADSTIIVSPTGTVTPITAAVPEPATLALFVTGFVGLMGLWRRRRERRELITA